MNKELAAFRQVHNIYLNPTIIVAKFVLALDITEPPCKELSLEASTYNDFPLGLCCHILSLSHCVGQLRGGIQSRGLSSRNDFVPLGARDTNAWVGFRLLPHVSCRSWKVESRGATDKPSLRFRDPTSPIFSHLMIIFIPNAIFLKTYIE